MTAFGAKIISQERDVRVMECVCESVWVGECNIYVCVCERERERESGPREMRAGHKIFF